MHLGEEGSMASWWRLLKICRGEARGLDCEIWGLRDGRGCCAEAIWRGGRAEEIGSRGRRAAAEDLAEKTALGVVAAMANKNREKLGLETGGPLMKIFGRECGLWACLFPHLLRL